MKRDDGKLSAGKARIHAIALAPLDDGVLALHEKKKEELKELVASAGVGDR